MAEVEGLPRTATQQTLHLAVDGLPITVIRKKMKYLRLAVKPPEGEVRVSVPWHSSPMEVEAFVRQHLAWIGEQQHKIRSRPVAQGLKYESGEQHFLWGQAYTLELTRTIRMRSVTMCEATRTLCILLRKNDTLEECQALMKRHWRAQLEAKIPALVAKYEPKMGVALNEWRTKLMKTRWGTCNMVDRRIWLNLALAKYPPQCLEYVVVHELAHLLEASHNRRFWGIVDQAMPSWQAAKILLKNNQYG